MVQSVEFRIHKLFLEHNDALKVADILLKEWEEGKLAWVEQETVGHFLIQSGFGRAFLEQILRNFKRGQKIPWASLAHALALSVESGKAKLTKEDFDQLFVGAGNEDSLNDLVKCTLLDKFDGRFHKVRSSLDNEPSGKAHVSHERGSNTSTVEKNFDPEITGTLISQIETRARDSDELKTKVKDVFSKALAQLSKDLPIQNPIRDAAIALAMMGAWAEGLEILRKEKPSRDRNLLELEFLLQADKNVEVLELSEKLLLQAPNLQQKSYIQYLQAQALIKIKKPNEAYTVLENLITDDPDYIAAQALMNQLRARTE